VKTLAVVLAGLGAALVVGNRPNLLQARLARPVDVAGAGKAMTGRAGGRERRGRPAISSRHQATAAIAAGALGGLVIGGPGLAALATAAAGLFVATRSRAMAARLRHQSDGDVSEACLLLAAELRAGAHPRRAVSVVAAEWPALFRTAARRVDVGGEVSSALREAAGPGRSALSAVAAGWEVSERTGAALSDVLTAVADALRADSAVRREAEAQLSTVRVTARLLAVLPVGTLLLLSGGDSAPVQFLFGTSYGFACLTGAVLLVMTGLWWIDRLVRTATPSSWS
jgi:tight adherence protein B